MGPKRTGAQARRRAWMLFGIHVFCLCSAFTVPGNVFHYNALDVSQGDALVVESGRFVMLNDGGGAAVASAIGYRITETARHCRS